MGRGLDAGGGGARGKSGEVFEWPLQKRKSGGRPTRPNRWDDREIRKVLGAQSKGGRIFVRVHILLRLG
jgi:hypothetical protein